MEQLTSAHGRVQNTPDEEFQKVLQKHLNRKKLLHKHLEEQQVNAGYPVRNCNLTVSKFYFHKVCVITLPSFLLVHPLELQICIAKTASALDKFCAKTASALDKFCTNFVNDPIENLLGSTLVRRFELKDWAD